MNNKPRLELVRKARKILAMKKSPNENEAANAAEMLLAFLAEHQLTYADIGDEKYEVEEDHEWLFRSAYWVRGICSSVAKLYFCLYYYSEKKIRVQGWKKVQTGDNHHFVGSETNIYVAKMMIQYLVTAVHELATSASMQQPRKGRVQFRNAFLLSCAHRLCQRLDAKRKQAENDGLVTEAGTTLPALLDAYKAAMAQNSEFLKERGKELMVDDPYLARSPEGIKAGAEAAETIPIDPMLGDQETTALINKAGMTE